MAYRTLLMDNEQDDLSSPGHGELLLYTIHIMLNGGCKIRYNLEQTN